MHILFKVFLAVVPLLITLLLGWLTMEGYLNFGGGEKDIILALPLLLWSVVYLCCYLALWWRRLSTARSVAGSGVLASGVVCGVVGSLFYGVLVHVSLAAERIGANSCL